MRIHLNLVIAVVTAAATYFVTLDDVSAAGRRGGGGGGSSVSRSGGGGGRSFSSSSFRSSGSSGRASSHSSSRFSSGSSSRGNSSFASSNSGGSSGRRFTNSNSSPPTLRNSGNPGRTQQFSQSNAGNRNTGRNTTISSNQNGSNRNIQNNGSNRNFQANNAANRNPQASILSPNQRSGLGVGAPRINTAPRTANTANNTLRNANTNTNTNSATNSLRANGNTNARTNNTPNTNLTNARPNATPNTNVNNARPNSTPNANLAANLRTNTSILRSTTTLPARLTVAANGLRLGRIAPPANLVTRLTLAAPRAGFLANRFKPFLQRHWRTAFFWVAIPTIGYLTIPDHAYDRFVTFVSGSDPDYDGAVKYLSQVAVTEDSNYVVRVAQNEVPPVRHVVDVEPAPIYDQRFTPFVNRKWNSESVTISVPRIGNVTCPVAIVDQVKPLLTQNPPKFDEALALIEEAAAADTVVDEGALNDAEIESIQ